MCGRQEAAVTGGGREGRGRMKLQGAEVEVGVEVRVRIESGKIGK